MRPLSLCVLVLAALGLAALTVGCGAVATGAEQVTAPTPAPSWLAEQAAREAARWGDEHPTLAYWGFLRDPELGRITASGPVDPSHHAYVLVLVGDYSKMYATASFLEPLSSPLPPIRWILFTYAKPDGDAGS